MSETQLSVTALLKLRKQAIQQEEDARKFRAFIENQLAKSLKAAAEKAGHQVDFQVSSRLPPDPSMSVRVEPIDIVSARGRISAGSP